MQGIYRIIDANLNRSREALRVLEDCGRFVLDDREVVEHTKNARGVLKQLKDAIGEEKLLTSRDTGGDVGTTVTGEVEASRSDLNEVVTAAAKRLTESLRTLEEYSKVVAPELPGRIERLRYDSYIIEQRIMRRLNVNEKLSQARLYVLLSKDMCPGGDIIATAKATIAGGADIIQLREKELCDDEFLALAIELRKLTTAAGVIFIINDRPDIALLCNADGLHLGQDDLPIAAARKILPPRMIIGRSTHHIEQSLQAVDEGADYIAVGPMFETQTKDKKPVGKELLAQAVEKIPNRPIVAIGGITTENVNQLIELGGKCFAVCGLVTRAIDPQKATAEFKKVLS